MFSDDKDRPNRYLLAKEQPNRPDSTDLEVSLLHYYFDVCFNNYEHHSMFKNENKIMGKSVFIDSRLSMYATDNLWRLC